MARKDAPISDDWQDVADDNLSVVSLPTSEDEDDSPDTNVDPKAGADADTATQTAQTDITPSYIASVSHDLTNLSLADEKKANINKPKDQTEEQSKADKNVKYNWAEPDDDYDDEAHTGHVPDVHMDPTFLRKVSTSTIKLIGEILSIVHFGAYSHAGEDSTDVRERIEDVCKPLRQHLKELTPIMEGYSKHWSPEKTTLGLPIDPGLYEWMSDLKVDLLGVQALLQDQMNCRQSSSASSTFLFDLDQHSKSLNESCDQMTSFMPIMKTDYDNFHTENLAVAEVQSISAARVPDLAEVGRRFSNPGRLSGHAQLRREVYELKDQISACTKGLDNLAERQPQSAKRRFFQLKDSYDGIKTTLDVLLSNHASEWIDHGLDGGITFPEFYRLNPDTVRSLNVQLKEIADSLTMERARARHMRYTSDPDMMLEHEPEALDSAVDSLKVVKEVLEDLFQVKKRHSISAEA